MSKKTTLTLSDKIKLIELKQQENISVKELMVKFKCGKTQVYEAIKNKDKVMEQWMSCKNSGNSKRVVSVGFEQVERDLYRWFISARSKGLPISGPILQAEATKLAENLGISNFRASNGWLDRFKRRHNIVYKQINGEANYVNQDTVENWKHKLSVLIKAKDIYNADETGLFCRGEIPTKSLVIKGDSCVDGKKSKDRLTVFMCGNMAGEIRKPLVISKSMKPCYFKNMNIATQQTHDSAISMVENEGEKDEDNDKNQYEEPENLIKDYKTAICYLEELQKFSLTVSNSELLNLISRAKECVECDALRNKKQKPITDFF